MDIKTKLSQGILLLDGAYATVFQSLNLSENDFRINPESLVTVEQMGNYECLNLSRPTLVQQLHEAYLTAGADILKTNTFSANAISQEKYQAENFVKEMNVASLRLAKTAAKQITDRPIWIAGTIGSTPLSLSTCPSSIFSEAKAKLQAAYSEQIAVLIAAGVDLLLLETVYDELNAIVALEVIAELQSRKKTAIPVSVSITVNNQNACISSGLSAEEVYEKLSFYPMLSFGINCSDGMDGLDVILSKLSEKLPVYLSLHPNTGLSKPLSAEKFVEKIDQIIQHADIHIVGGCCGTTPEYIRALRRFNKTV